MNLKPITIAGGGLAGLTLGIGLRQRGIPVTICEAGHYPRHRVCGEFISGHGQEALARLGLTDSFVRAGAIEARTGAFYLGGATSPVRPLPRPALCLSRYTMDALLAAQFREQGGELRENVRWQDGKFSEGVVRATGRRPHPAENNWRWFGLKVHVRKVALAADLEMHAARNGYVGICRLDGGQVNVCGLFRRPARGGEVLPRRQDLLRGEPGTSLHRRLSRAVFDEGSFCSVAGLALKPRRATRLPECSVGDALTMIPPVTGNGMSMAFEAAEKAIAPLVAFSLGHMSWEEARRHVANACDVAFAHRLFWARLLQWLMFTPAMKTRLAALLLHSNWVWKTMFANTR
jgi:2-polyprenyl-6-methoxyphenol hydroxylase-like FAD-dependent oxidoreductase